MVLIFCLRLHCLQSAAHAAGTSRPTWVQSGTAQSPCTLLMLGIGCETPWPFWGAEKAPQRTYVTKILPNFRVNFLVRFASKPLFYWVVPSNCSQHVLVVFVRFFGFGVLFWPLTFSSRKPPALTSINLREDPWPFFCRKPPALSSNPPLVDSACADCPGFLGAAPASASTFVSEPQIVPLGKHFASWALGHLLGSAARSSPTTRAKTGRARAAHVFTAQGAENGPQISKWRLLTSVNILFSAIFPPPSAWGSHCPSFTQ